MCIPALVRVLYHHCQEVLWCLFPVSLTTETASYEIRRRNLVLSVLQLHMSPFAYPSFVIFINVWFILFIYGQHSVV